MGEGGGAMGAMLYHRSYGDSPHEPQEEGRTISNQSGAVIAGRCCFNSAPHKVPIVALPLSNHIPK